MGKTLHFIQRHIKKGIVSFLAAAMILSAASSAFAANAITSGFAGINNYGNCGHADRAGVNYCNNFHAGLTNIRLSLNGITYSRSYNWSNNEVTTTKIANASQVTFFVYSGHGVIADTTNNALHVNQPSSGATLSHATLGESSYLINLKTTSTSFPHKYVVLYTCNQLMNGGSTTKEANIFKMLNGTRMLFGFASQMYLDSREATLFTQNMKSQTLLNAFFNAAKRYQTANSTPVIARVMGYKLAANDYITTQYAYAPSYNSSPSSFGYLGKDVTIS
ncbi:MAG: DUF6345 domain-containing protein [Clostridiales bacterium]|nr:DUF6345 domain-containing protein [Clostridiales bacterium]MDD6936961.1 DUF6345 domain-containing protein [Clostridiales bacterium]MDY2961367.1 DUF6345 domain-containing protein [Oscillospiraceae bacterium]